MKLETKRKKRVNEVREKEKIFEVRNKEKEKIFEVRNKEKEKSK